ncbi:MAG TPA: hypothetical protein VG937_00670 [Polyangiaceae bacterium]|nr:hypothetical protein [Polyangiaceae bacterium]
MADSGVSTAAEPSLAERLEDLERIAKLSDPVLRNLLITQRYCDLSRSLARVLGPANANWSTFATWASKTAGQSIREEEVPPEFVEFLQSEARLSARLEHFYKLLGPLARFAPRLDPFDLARAIIQEVASQIALGNLRVYAELTPLFAEFSHAFSTPAGRSEEALERFLAKLASGPAEKGGQDCLKQAFRHYFQASLLADELARVELILLGNVLIGLHEQTRLQENIAGALDAPFSARVYERFGAAGPKFLHRPLRALLRAGVGFFARELLDDWQRFATRLLMKLAAPNGEDIPLGHDLPPERFDPLLAREKLQNPELIAFLTLYDANLTTTRGSAAVNWTILRDRMRFIGELFRVSQRDPSWFGDPFLTTQRADFEAGRIPNGRL